MSGAIPIGSNTGLLGTDAQNWPDQITISLQVNKTTTTTGAVQGDGSSVTTTKVVSGSASWTLTRASFADYIQNPQMPITDDGTIANAVSGVGSFNTSIGEPYGLIGQLAQGEYLPVQCAIGKMPGWIMMFNNGNPPDPVKGAITTQTTVLTNNPPPYTGPTPPGPPQNPVVTTNQSDAAFPYFGAVCGQVAPGRTITFTDPGNGPGYAGVYFLGINAGFPSFPIDQSSVLTGQSFQCELLQPGIAATTTPAVLPVYRITLPDEYFYGNTGPDPGGATTTINPSTIVYNGATVNWGSNIIGRGDWNTLQFYSAATNTSAQVFPRSHLVCDVQLPNVTDTLAAGTVDYAPAEDNLDSFLLVGQFHISGINPFPMAGQSFSSNDADPNDPPDDSGYVYTVQF